MPKAIETMSGTDVHHNATDQEWLHQIVEQRHDSCAPEPRQSGERGGAVIGVLVALDGTGNPLVDYPAERSRQPVRARATVPLSQKDISREVVLLFDRGNHAEPIIVGVIRPPVRPYKDGPEVETPVSLAAAVEVDGNRLVLRAEKEIVLCCGDSSITLTRAGKVLIRGAYILSRSSGVNLVKGAAVQIN